MEDGARRRGISERAWLAQFSSDPTVLPEVLAAVTIHESSWFRDPAQYRSLQRAVLPGASRPFIWSAGCGLGQEPYSLAMLLRESGRRNWRVLATDIDATAVSSARAAHYSPTQLVGLDPVRRSRWLRPVAKGFTVAPDLTRCVEFRQHNLAVDPLPPEVAGCDVVFCRNVLIYLDETAATRFLDCLAAALSPTATLFVGGSEALWRAADRFEAVDLGGCYGYRPRRTPRVQRASVPVHPGPAETPDPARFLADGQSAFERGDHEAAIPLLRRAIRARADQVVAQFTLGLALTATGDGGGARTAWEAARAVLYDPHTSDADRCAIESLLDGHTIADLGAALDALLDEQTTGRPHEDRLGE